MKLCKDCKNMDMVVFEAISGAGGREAVCSVASDIDVSAVDGKPRYFRKIKCEDARKNDLHCGPEAKHFKQRDPGFFKRLFGR